MNTDRAAGNLRPVPQRAQREGVLVQLRARPAPHGARRPPQPRRPEAARPQRLPAVGPLARVLGGRPEEEEEDRGADRGEEGGRRSGGRRELKKKNCLFCVLIDNLVVASELVYAQYKEKHFITLKLLGRV